MLDFINKKLARVYIYLADYAVHIFRCIAFHFFLPWNNLGLVKDWQVRYFEIFDSTQ